MSNKTQEETHDDKNGHNKNATNDADTLERKESKE